MSGTGPSPSTEQKKYKGVRRRKWGKWVSEIRVPGTQERLWLGSYSTAEAAAVAHDVASYCLRAGDGRLNFPLMLPASVKADMSPKSIQKSASDAGMAIDAQMILNRSMSSNGGNQCSRNGSYAVNLGQEGELGWEDGVGSNGSWSGGQGRDYGGDGDLSISVEDYS
ncbi:ethylene-responsive transcription factor ERF020 [Ricinus communis]|uniref:Transcriptional factor TINY, putative n=1 Tax=Ricinus communis TaxID=3988 RepID=B9SPX2_RICCO|nr:ethylene-responsive transcription factor ERF020 [Ricinus communis]EEF34359.1 Transcriptional factor TINY, putative [Ricinus communis]|eukprot:XP_002528041.1 ethylene-responsive transcription factor ERF020 [Ricinus communis]